MLYSTKINAGAAQKIDRKDVSVEVEEVISCSRPLQLKTVLIAALGSFTVGCAFSPLSFEKATGFNHYKNKHQLSKSFESQAYNPHDEQVPEVSDHVAPAQTKAPLVKNPASQAAYEQSMQQKLDALNLEIELLTLENQRIKDKNQYIEQKKKREKVQNLDFKLSDEYLALRQDVSMAKESIELTLNQLEIAPASLAVPAYQPGNTFGLQQESNGTAYFSNVNEDKPSSYEVEYKGLYHTVYVTSEKPDWLTLWDRLADASVTDKWKGFSTSKGVYFIYVGAYAQMVFAEKRQEDLLQRIGLAPDIVTGDNKEERIEKMAALVQNKKG